MNLTLTKAEKKYLNALSLKKYRDREACFIVEGEKSVAEFAASDFSVKKIYKTQDCKFSDNSVETVLISTSEMQQISNLKTPSPVLAVVEIPDSKMSEFSENDLILVLDDIQDPGNLGALIRLADWFGIRQIICSPFSADAYGPKTVQATMGSLTRTHVNYRNLPDFLKSLNGKIPVYGTFLNGEIIYSSQLSSSGIIVMGNEGKGISSEVARHVSRRLYIPAFNENRPESLNVTTAAAIVCSEFRRRTRCDVQSMLL
ncbi:MAG: RNA methyltransferase [Prevotellaceae bacterium]|jgi:TrmH family RNA methyltransferase|nr:RNA methyltransferase [Prevotellaceae bacterium]